jgi:hypothetical protein
MLPIDAAAVEPEVFLKFVFFRPFSFSDMTKTQSCELNHYSEA